MIVCFALRWNIEVIPLYVISSGFDLVRNGWDIAMWLKMFLSNYDDPRVKVDLNYQFVKFSTLDSHVSSFCVQVVITALIGDLSVRKETFYAVWTGLSFIIRHIHMKDLLNSIDLSRFVSSRYRKIAGVLSYRLLKRSYFNLQGLPAQGRLAEVSLASLFLMTLVLEAL